MYTVNRGILVLVWMGYYEGILPERSKELEMLPRRKKRRATTTYLKPRPSIIAKHAHFAAAENRILLRKPSPGIA